MSPLNDRQGPNPIDFHVGVRLRLLRRIRGMRATDLGAAVDLNAFQIQKYEAGVSRLSAAKLFEIAGALGASVSYFFEGLPPRDSVIEVPTKASNDADPAALEILNRPEMKELIAAFACIDGARLRECCQTLIGLLSHVQSGEDKDGIEPG